MEFSGVDIPEANRFVPTATGERAAIRTETHAIDIVGVSGERLLEFSGVDIPEANRFVLTATGERVAIRTETHLPESEECLAVFSGVNIP